MKKRILYKDEPHGSSSIGWQKRPAREVNDSLASISQPSRHAFFRANGCDEPKSYFHPNFQAVIITREQKARTVTYVYFPAVAPPLALAISGKAMPEPANAARLAAAAF